MTTATEQVYVAQRAADYNDAEWASASTVLLYVRYNNTDNHAEASTLLAQCSQVFAGDRGGNMNEQLHVISMPMCIIYGLGRVRISNPKSMQAGGLTM